MRIAFVLLLAACLGRSKPAVDHNVELAIHGLSNTGPATYRVRVDLDHRTLVTSIPGDEITTPQIRTRGPDKQTTRELPDATIDEIRRLAASARYEELGPESHVTDHLEVLTFDGDPAKEISQPEITGPAARRLSKRLTELAGF